MNNFIPKDFLVKELRNKDIVRIRGALLNYFIEDRADEKKEIRKAIEYVEKNTDENLWQKNDENEYEIKKDPSQWNNEYYSLQLVYLGSNFSKERVEHVLKVGKHLYSNPEVSRSTASKQNEVKKNTTQFQKKIQNTPQKNHKPNPQKKNMTLLMLILLIVAIVVVVLLVLFLNNNQSQAIVNFQNQNIRALNHLEKIYTSKMM